MGWWISSKRSKSRRKPTGGARRAKPKRKADPQRRAAMWRGAMWLVLIGGIVAGAWFGQRALIEHIGQRRAAEPVRVELTDAPAWLGERRLAALRDAVAGAIAADPLDQASLRRAVEALAANPWVEQVHRVTRAGAGRIVAAASYRQPVALIGARDGFHLVDRAGHRLPGVYAYQELRALGLPAITGVRAAPPAQGHAWPGEDVRAGIALALQIAAEPWAGQVRGIDVANYRGRAQHGYPHLTLITARGAVRWGRAVGQEEIYEPPADQKLAMLREVQQSYGSIDANGQTVDVYLDTPMIHADAAAPRYTSDRE